MFETNDDARQNPAYRKTYIFFLLIMRLYIAVLDEFPDYMVPTLVAHSMLAAHLQMQDHPQYQTWLPIFKKCTVRVNQKEFDKIAALPGTYLGHENKTLDARKSCAIPLPVDDSALPNV